MTPKQLKTLQAIKRWHAQFGYMPTNRELVMEVGLKSTSEAHRLINGLIERGYLRRLSKRARALEIVEHPSLPKDLSQFSVGDIAREARRRGLALGTVVTEIHHAQGEAPKTIKRFREITEDGNV